MARLGRPTKFSREQLQRAALALVDEKGLSGLSMRALASRLGTGAMTVYNYVANREELDILVVDAIFAETSIPSARHDDWRGDVRRIAMALRQSIRSHPNAIPLILTRRNRSLALLKIIEALLAALRRGGRSGYELLLAFRVITAFVTGFSQSELSGPIAVAAGETTEVVTSRTKALPVDQFPALIELATAAASSDPEREFADSLDRLISGLSGE